MLIDERVANLVLTADLGRTIRLEGCLGGNVPSGARPYGGARSPCAGLARLKPVELVYGPGTFLNESSRSCAVTAVLHGADGLVEERAGAVDELDRSRAARACARTARAAVRAGARRDVAAEAALEADRAAEVGGQHEVGDALVDQHDDGVVAEAAVQLVGRSNASEERLASVSAPVLGSSRSASSPPPSASSATASSTGSGRAAAARATRSSPSRTLMSRRGGGA